MPPPWPKPHSSGPPPLPGFNPFDGAVGQRSPLGRWLLDPGASLRDTAGWWCSALLGYGPIAGAGVILATIAAVTLRRVLDTLRLARWRDRARWVLIVLPGNVEAEGGQRLWERLHAIARPWLTRWRHGQPHVGFEIHAIPGRIVIGMWVPSVIPPGLVEHAIRGAWPGVEVDITYTDIPDPSPPPPDGQTRIVEGTRLVLGRHAALPLRAHHTSDPLRSVLASLHHLSESQTACIQILARPLTGGPRVSLARRAAIRMATSPTVNPSLLAMNPTGERLARLGLDVLLSALSALARLLLDVISPTTLTTTGRGSHHGHRDQSAQRRGPRPPFTRDIATASGVKTGAAQAMWAVHTTLVTTTLLPDTASDAAARNTREETKGRAATLAAGFRVYCAHNQLRRRRLRHPDTLGMRTMGPGQLMGTDELAALAHLPLDERTAGLDRIGAIPVAPPPGIPTGPTSPNPRPTPDETGDEPDTGRGPASPTPPTRGRQASGEPAPAAPPPDEPPPAIEQIPTPRQTVSPTHTPTRQTSTPPTAATGQTAANEPPTGGRSDGSTSRPRRVRGPGLAVANWSGAVVLGDSNAGPRRPIALSVRDRARHVLMLGSTGCGKSSLMARMVLADCEAGRGVILIDPKTDAARDVDDRLDPATRKRLVLIDPDGPGPVPLLNLLDPHDPVAVDNLVAVFASIYRRSWGDRIAEAFRMGCQAVIAHYHHKVRLEAQKHREGHEKSAPVKTPTLRHVLELFTKPTLRAEVIAALREQKDLDPAADATADAGAGTGVEAGINEDIATYWEAFNNRSDAGQDRDSAAVLNKLRGLLLRDRFTRQLLTGDGPPLDMTAVLDGGICLARLPEGLLGSDTTSLIGSLLVAKVWQATTARARQREHHRAPAALYLDEAHRFMHLHTPIETMLSQARGYALGMVLALQNFAQLGTREVREGVSANTLHKLFFRLSPEDATHAERHTYPLLTAHDLQHLDNFTAAVRLQPDGIDRPAFTLRTRPLPDLPPTTPPTEHPAPGSPPADPDGSAA
jgi:hypothetical protein